jgi:hypothetical protein
MSQLQKFMDSAAAITPVFGLVPNRQEEQRQTAPGSQRGRAAPPSWRPGSRAMARRRS